MVFSSSPPHEPEVSATREKVVDEGAKRSKRKPRGIESTIVAGLRRTQDNARKAITGVG